MFHKRIDKHSKAVMDGSSRNITLPQFLTFLQTTDNIIHIRTQVLSCGQQGSVLQTAEQVILMFLLSPVCFIV